MKKADKKAELIRKLQEELDQRTQVEEEAIRLMENCEFEKAQELLGSLDDSIVKEIERELEQLDADSGKTSGAAGVTTCRKYEVERELAKNAGTNVKEEDYQKLANMCDTKHMTDEEASLFIGKELGFDPLKVKIIHEVEDYYKDGCRLKKWHTYRRDPQYNATDWNYFRFDVCGWQYEYENGTLRFYNS